MPSALCALVVDDVAAVRSYIKQILQSLGINSVFEAADGNSARQLFSQYHPDMVFLDIQLPDIDGQQLLKRFRLEHEPAVVFMVSAFSSVDNLKMAVENGASAFVVKPFSASRITRLVQPLLH